MDWRGIIPPQYIESQKRFRKVVLNPPNFEPGSWIGAGRVFYDSFYEEYLLSVRPRKAPPTRAYEVRVYSSSNGESFYLKSRITKEEIAEHLVFPLLLLGFSAVFSAYPIIFQLSILAAMIGLYGFCFGEIRTERDLLKILVLVNLLLTLWWLSTLVMWIDYAWGIKGILTWSLLSAATVLTYLKAKGRMTVREK